MIETLINIDRACFLFINNGLSNPIFDFMMPLFDETKYFIDSNDNLVVLKNSNKVLDNFEVQEIQNYREEIISFVPYFYFIWERPLDFSVFDIDTDPELNQYPREIIYRLELVKDNDKVYVIEDEIN